jgi:hypothetical protein
VWSASQISPDVQNFEKYGSAFQHCKLAIKLMIEKCVLNALYVFLKKKLIENILNNILYFLLAY